MSILGIIFFLKAHASRRLWITLTEIRTLDSMAGKNIFGVLIKVEFYPPKI